MTQIRKGNTGQAVRVLQFLFGLKATSSKFDDALDKAIRAFQSRVKIKVDGICGPITWGKLAGAQKTIRSGSRGNAVKAAQEILGVAVDGIFGPITAGAVKALQKAGGLKEDGVIGPVTWKYLLTVHDPAGAVKPPPAQPIDFKQYDSRWAKLPYTVNPKASPPQTIKSSGCGPTAAADIVAALFNPKITPVEMCKAAVDRGYRTRSSGTSRAFFDWLATQYPFKDYKRTTNTSILTAALMSGKAWAVALMGPGHFTTGGHYICCYDYDQANNYIHAHDPGSSTRKGASASVFSKERKEYFIYYFN
jgi:peptidoglycan hydrolase-like protein with peptidoglycan-binding domain